MLVLFYPSVIPSLFSFGFVFVVLKCWALDPVFPISRTVQVRYGYFAEPRPVHVACARGWMDMYDDITETYYEVSCYPQSSGRFAAARLDSGELHLAHLGSAPLAEALARGLRLVLLYITQYAGDSQGMYVRPGSNITNPLDLVDKTIGVPFGSTMHYQVLFLLNLFGLKGKARLLDLSPSEIIKAWDEGRIDIGACWGIARDYLLKLGGAGNPDIDPATPLVSAKVISDWGRETFTMLVADKKFTDEHPRFITYVTAVLSRLNDSYLDRLGLIDPKMPKDGQQQIPAPLQPVWLTH
ncbi:taurine ABC transporter periplasmic binding protein [Nitzschia inconspicua]|uniref:Taurine ABC transporter periplasmic binding protein n=1 Tax=Nitzschia inconspicua TaxID=303405 RepID=A0A9K3K5W0_9STRA|nr:taurine ABC transporter periplasmic binding protein [Nitzschia inconspicua]